MKLLFEMENVSSVIRVSKVLCFEAIFYWDYHVFPVLPVAVLYFI